MRRDKTKRHKEGMVRTGRHKVEIIQTRHKEQMVQLGKGLERGGEREGGRGRETDRQRQRQRHTERGERETDRQTETESERKTNQNDPAQAQTDSCRTNSSPTNRNQSGRCHSTVPTCQHVRHGRAVLLLPRCLGQPRLSGTARPGFQPA